MKLKFKMKNYLLTILGAFMISTTLARKLSLPFASNLMADDPTNLSTTGLTKCSYESVT
jgi:hypothetical protein